MVSGQLDLRANWEATVPAGFLKLQLCSSTEVFRLLHCKYA
jgi:hypothetical protein